MWSKLVIWVNLQTNDPPFSRPQNWLSWLVLWLCIWVEDIFTKKKRFAISAFHFDQVFTSLVRNSISIVRKIVVWEVAKLELFQMVPPSIGQISAASVPDSVLSKLNFEKHVWVVFEQVPATFLSNQVVLYFK